MKQDRRVQKTELLYQEALLTLLKRKSIKQISIKELSEHACLHRGTFYLHYKGIEELLYSIEKRIMYRLETICEQNTKDAFHTVPYSTLLDIFRFLDEHREIMTIFMDRDTYFVSEMKRILTIYCVYKCQMIYQQASKEELDFISGYTVEGILFVLNAWLHNEHRHSAEEMAIRLQRVILHGIDALGK